MVYAGMVPGVMFNNEREGFMHKARVDCTLFNDVNKGRANARSTQLLALLGSLMSMRATLATR